MSRVFGGEGSKELWNEINSLDEMSTGADVSDVLYSMGCKMQELEAKIAKDIDKMTQNRRTSNDSRGEAQ